MKKGLETHKNGSDFLISPADDQSLGHASAIPLGVQGLFC